MDYAAAHMASVYGLKREYGSLDLVLEIMNREDGDGWFEGVLQCKNNSTDDLDDILIELVSPKGPAVVTFNHDTIYRPENEGRSIRLNTLETFQTISVPFMVHNIQERQPILLFRVSIENNIQYFVREIISLKPRVNGGIQVTLD